MPATPTEKDPSELSPVKFSRLSKRGILLGLSLAQLIVLAVAIASFVIGMMIGGAWALYAATVWVPALAITFIPAGGRPIVEWAPIAPDLGVAVDDRAAPSPRPRRPPEARRNARPARGCGLAAAVHRSGDRGGDGPRPAPSDAHRAHRDPSLLVRAPRPRRAGAPRPGVGACTGHRMPLRAHRTHPGARAHHPRLRHRPGPVVGTARHRRRILGRRDLQAAHRPRRTRRRTARIDAVTEPGHEGGSPADPRRRTRPERCRRSTAAGDADPDDRAARRRARRERVGHPGTPGDHAAHRLRPRRDRDPRPGR